MDMVAGVDWNCRVWRMRKMKKLPYIEPSIRTIAGALITVAGILLYVRPDMKVASMVLLFFVSLNLFQSGFTQFCPMFNILAKLGVPRFPSGCCEK